MHGKIEITARLTNGAATLYLPEELEPQDCEEMREWLAYMQGKLNRMEATQTGSAESHQEEAASE